MSSDNRLPYITIPAQLAVSGWRILPTLFAVAGLGWGVLQLAVLLPRLGAIQAPWSSNLLIGSGIVELWAWAAFSLTLLVIGRGIQLVAAERNVRLTTLPIMVEG